MSHDSSEIILICWFVAQETFIIISVKNYRMLFCHSIKRYFLSHNSDFFPRTLREVSECWDLNLQLWEKNWDFFQDYFFRHVQKYMYLFETELFYNNFFKSLLSLWSILMHPCRISINFCQKSWPQAFECMNQFLLEGMIHMFRIVNTLKLKYWFGFYWLSLYGQNSSKYLLLCTARKNYTGLEQCEGE